MYIQVYKEPEVYNINAYTHTHTHTHTHAGGQRARSLSVSQQGRRPALHARDHSK